jgi:alpha-ketoglutarate-dependent taurine dioxygenase
VVFFRDQNVNDDQHAEFSARFGRLYPHPSVKRHDNISQLHRIAAVDFATYDHTPDATSVESGYHTDTSWRLVPAWGAVLRAVSDCRRAAIRRSSATFGTGATPPSHRAPGRYYSLGESDVLTF